MLQTDLLENVELGSKPFSRNGQTQHKLKIVAVCGAKNSGKHLLVDYLQQTRHGVYQICFADPIRKTCKELFYFNNDQLHGNLRDQEDERWGFTPRFAMQIIGTEVGREFLPSVFQNKIAKDSLWITLYHIRLLELLRKNTNVSLVVTPDLRNMEEYKYLVQRGDVYTIRVYQYHEKSPDYHASEISSQIIPADFEVRNPPDGNLLKYYHNIEENLGYVLPPNPLKLRLFMLKLKMKMYVDSFLRVFC